MPQGHDRRNLLRRLHLLILLTLSLSLLTWAPLATTILMMIIIIIIVVVQASVETKTGPTASRTRRTRRQACLSPADVNLLLLSLHQTTKEIRKNRKEVGLAAGSTRQDISALTFLTNECLDGILVDQILGLELGAGSSLDGRGGLTSRISSACVPSE